MYKMKNSTFNKLHYKTVVEWEKVQLAKLYNLKHFSTARGQETSAIQIIP